MAHKILVPLDGSMEAEAILPEARRLAPAGSEIHLLHVAPLPTPPTGPPTRLLGLYEMAIPYLESVRERLGMPRGLSLVRSGDPADAILQAALELNIDLIAMTSHARAGLRRWYLGSVAETVVRTAQLPVLLRRPEVPVRGTPFRRILVPLDGSKRSSSILDVVKPIAARTGAELVVLHVTPLVPDPAPQWAMKGPISLGASPGHRYQEIADHLAQEDLAAWSTLAEGDAAEVILKQARELDVDLIAMATHGKTGLARSLFGSVTQAVLRGSDRPVLLIRPTKGVRND